MGDALEDELDYEELSPAPKPARAAGGGKSGAATKQAEAVDAAEIYGDLFAPAAPAAPDATAGGGLPAPGSIAALEADELRRRAASQAASIAALQAEVEVLKAERAAWLAERATLLTNMSSLFLTAKAELARKDGVIKEARASAAAGGL